MPITFGEDFTFIGAAIPGMPGGENVGGNEASEPGEAAQITNTEVGTAPVTVVAQEEPAPTGSMLPMLAIWGAVFVGMWFLMIRPQRKREKQMKELQAAITTGDNIVTSGGLFGSVVGVGEDCFIIEFGTNRGVRVPVLKADVVAVRSPKMTPQPEKTDLSK
ncbi:MAG: preprotein translocase subunit YajC [Clostridiales bacterium]|jgi:preprotein translocase subunit YajC|nr:preprotein translocase subunit YajC [Clostridiales bacterium]